MLFPEPFSDAEVQQKTDINFNCTNYFPGKSRKSRLSEFDLDRFLPPTTMGNDIACRVSFF